MGRLSLPNKMNKCRVKLDLKSEGFLYEGLLRACGMPGFKVKETCDV